MASGRPTAGKVAVVAGVVCAAIALATMQHAAAQVRPAQAAPAAVQSHRALLDQFCVTCHNATLKTAGLQLDHVDLANVGEDADLWEKVAKKLRSGAMPPPGRPRPETGVARAFTSWLETSLDTAAMANPHPGRPTVHRLNRTEYTNAVRDLLALDIDGRALLPADDTDKHGFDNIADVLSVSPAWLERYMSAARKISRMAIGATPAPPTTTDYRVPKTLRQDQRLGEDLPLGSRGGIAVRHHFPADGEYRIKIRLQRNLYEMIRGLGSRHELEVRLDRIRLAHFSVGGEMPGEMAPLAHGGTIDGSPEWERYVREADASLEITVPVKAGTRSVTAAFANEILVREEEPQPLQVGFGRDTNEMFDDLPAIDTVTVAGPLQVTGRTDTPSHRKIFVCRPTRAAAEAECARTILSTLARRAYRRPVTEDDLQFLLRYYQARGGEPFDARIELALQMLLTSPDFLFRAERDVAPGTAGPQRVGDLELASRLSFFLWSSIPDETLLNLASAGTLSEPATLEKQVRRMLADPRSSALVDNFVGQWLVVRNVRDLAPDPDLFPGFDDNLRLALQRETELFVASQIRDDRSLVELLSADYTFVNERLARHYGIPNVYGERFRRVTFGKAEHRGGLLAHGSVLAVTSYPNRTSPVLRGKWLLENILGTPPPEPPPNVPALKENAIGQTLSVRARLEEHRRNVVCSTCHAPMDPLGFALENFDAIGAWRTTDSGASIDASGALPGGVQFNGVAGLKNVLTTTYREQFVRTVVERLLTYALGRQVEAPDMPTVRAVTRQAAGTDYRWSSVVLNIVNSLPFRMSTSARSEVARNVHD